MITVHNLENSQSIRILWLLEELGVDYNIKQYYRDKETSFASDEYRKIHPVGWAPTITDGGVAMAETNAIVDYILDKHTDNSLRPKEGEQGREAYLYWFHATQGSLMPFLVWSLVLNRMDNGVPFFIKPIVKALTKKVRAQFVAPRTDKLLTHLNNCLLNNQWLAGDTFTAADIVMGYCLEGLDARAGEHHSYTHITRYMSDMRSRDAYKIAMKKNGAFNPILD